MKSSISNFFRQHPIIRDALVWSVPALVVGAALRVLLLSYSPYAYWGSDSRSFFGFTNGVLTEFYFSINEKRRYLYPLFLFPISLLPGGTLKWLGWIQAGLGLLSLLPLAYLVRRTLTAWRWWIVPLTVVFAGMPVMLWYEHELIAETIFFDCIVWALGGWAAWVSQTDRARGRRLWWWFWVPLAILMLTKPSGKFLWPGIALALLLVGAWRILQWREWLALGGLFLASLTVGDDDQSAWLLFNTAFPLTRLDSPLHAEYKAEIRDWVEERRSRIHAYAFEDYPVQAYLRSAKDHPQRPKFHALAKNSKALEKVYKDLAFEGIKAHPEFFLYIALTRLAGSCNQADFDPKRFNATYFAERLQTQHENKRNPESMMRIAFDIDRDAPFPPFEHFRQRICPDPDAPAAKWMLNYAHTYQAFGALIERPADKNSPLSAYRLTWLGWLVLAGAIGSLAGPYRRTLGVWTIAFGGYVVAVYLVGILHHRYFAPAWPLVVTLLAVVPDWIASLIRSRAQDLNRLLNRQVPA